MHRPTPIPNALESQVPLLDVGQQQLLHGYEYIQKPPSVSAAHSAPLGLVPRHQLAQPIGFDGHHHIITVLVARQQKGIPIRLAD